ncbi:MAG: cytochrome c [Flavobacteriaceae bacterium]|nr:cytochrome c [Flavobacteriaceae bacterium]
MIQNLNDVTVNLPEAPGKDLVIRHCITCHSLRYIEMQPNFSEKAWQKTVDKMRKNFGAPIPEKDAAAIVKYLVRVKGKK